MVDARGARTTRCTSEAETTLEGGGRILARMGVDIHRSRSVSAVDAISLHSRSTAGISDQIPPFSILVGMIRVRRWDRPMGPAQQYMRIDCMEFRRLFNPPPLQNQAAHTSPPRILQEEQHLDQ